MLCIPSSRIYLCSLRWIIWSETSFGALRLIQENNFILDHGILFVRVESLGDWAFVNLNTSIEPLLLNLVGILLLTNGGCGFFLLSPNIYEVGSSSVCKIVLLLPHGLCKVFGSAKISLSRTYLLSLGHPLSLLIFNDPWIPSLPGFSHSKPPL